MAELVGSRSIFRVGYPLQAITKAIDTGLLPTLDQTKAPVGYDLGYDFSGFGAVANPVAADARLLELGGLPVVLAREPEPELPWWQQALLIGGSLLGFTSVGGAFQGLLQGAQGTADPVDPMTEKPVGFTSLTAQGGRTMAFQDGDTGFFGNMGFGDIFSGIGQALQGPLGQNLLNIGTQAATGFINQQFAQPMTTMAAVPAVVGAGRAVATVGRGFFNRFPNLATALQGLRNRGANVSRSSLYSAMRRFGPEMLVSGGILTAAAVSELAVAGPGRRRMNPGNVKALRRAHRRMKSFHHLCTDNDMLYKRSRRK